MLYNTAKNTWHPIIYFESPFPGPLSKSSSTRFKSMGHHTGGFVSREDAIADVNKQELVIKEKTLYTNIIREIDEDMYWDGKGVPADIQVR